MTTDPLSPSERPDRLDALLGAAAVAGDELADLEAVIRRLRSADSVADVAVDPEASWRRLESFLDGHGTPDRVGHPVPSDGELSDG